jgi:site-specific DNA-cytosine methylase
LLKEIKPKYFLLENVRMKKEFLQVISEQVSDCYPEIPFGIEPIFINSSLVSAQSRQRYYWTNIPNIQQPEDKGIVLRDILETEVDDNLDKMTSKEGKAHCLTASYTGAVPWNSIEKRQRTMVPVNKPIKVGMNVVTGGAFRGRAYDIDGKRMDRDGSSVANKTKQMLELRRDNKSNAITTVGKDSVVANEDLTWRKLTPLECERLQTVPDNYTNHVSNTQRYKMLGNGWTVDVICHIFKNME